MFKEEITRKQLIEILVVTLILGIGIFIYDYVNNQKNFNGFIERKEAGLGVNSEELNLYVGESKEKITVNISEQALTKEEIDEAFESAIEEINESYLGKNPSANNVSYDLNLKKSYVNGIIKAAWEFDNYSVITSEGVINHKKVPKAGELVEARVELKYKEESRNHSFSIIVKPLDVTTIEGRKEAIEEAVKEADEKNPTEGSVLLPEDAEGLKLTWKKKIDFRGLEIALLGVAAVLGIIMGKKQDAKKEKQRLLLEKEQDYPLIVSELSILMGAGMSLRIAFERMSKRYQKKKIDNPKYERAGYEEIVMTYRQMSDGVGEITALENLGKRCDQKDYRKLSLMLMQNIKKGSRDLTFALEKEEAVAFEMRKQRAMRLGEEASTKMLFPMGGMLMVVMVILIVPAIMQMNI